MSDHLPIKLDLLEMNVREIGYRTKRFFLNNVVMHLIDKYILNFDDLFEHLYTNYGICIILENNYSIDDVVEGVQYVYV